MVHVFDKLVDCRSIQGKTHYTVKFKKQTVPDRVVSFDDIAAELLEEYHCKRVNSLTETSSLNFCCKR